MFTRRALTGALTMMAMTSALAAQSTEKPLVVVLIGPPASGKTTQAEYLNQKYKLPVISVEDLIAQEAGGKPAAMKRSDPQVDELVRAKLTSMDISRGFVLDGYPATREQADFLGELVKGMKLPAPVIIQIHVPDRVVQERSRARGGPEDKPEIVAARLAEYHREMDVLRAYYPEADIWTIDGTRPVKGVSTTIRLLVEERLE